MKNIYRNFQRQKTVVNCAFFAAAVIMFLFSFVIRDLHAWWSNLLMGIGASCLASVMFAIVTSFPDKYRRLKEDTDEKRAIIHSRWEAIDLARLNFKDYLEAGNYERALGYVGYMHEKCGVLCSQFDDAQGYQHMLQKDKTIDDYRIEFEAAEKQYHLLYSEIETERQPFSDNNPKREEFIRRMIEVMARFYDNYDKIYGIQLKEASEIERIKFRNRY